MTARTFAELDPHLAAWDELAWAAPQELPTSSPAWVDAFLRHRLQPGEGWLCQFAYADEELVGVLPSIATPHPVLGARWPVLRSPSDPYTTSGDVLLASQAGVEALPALLSAVARELPSHLGFDLRAVHPSSPVWAALRSGLDGYFVHERPIEPYSVIGVRGDFDDYLAGLGNMRRNVKRYRKRLEDRGPVTFEIKTELADSESFLEEFLVLEGSGWKGRNGTAIQNDPAVTAFFSTLLRNFAARGHWEWHVLRVGDRVVAAGMGIRQGDSLILPKIAYDEELSDLMPGNLLTLEVIKDAFRRSELAEIKHMSCAAWHSSWRMGQQRHVDVRLVRRRPVAVAAHWPRVAAGTAYLNHVRPRARAALASYEASRRQ